MAKKITKRPLEQEKKEWTEGVAILRKFKEILKNWVLKT
jgi:hypothetical protein